MNTPSFSRSSAGFTLVELMVSLVIGLIVTGAVVAFTMSALNSNSDYVQSTQLTQELRSTIDYAGRELRRAGYDENALTYYSQAMDSAVIATSNFALLQIVNPTTNPAAPNANACVVYAYDRRPGTPGTVENGNGEVRAIRRVQRTVAGRQVGVIEIGESSAAGSPTCDGNSPNYNTYPATCSADGWCAYTDPRVLNIASFSVDTTRDVEIPAVTNGTPLSIRSLDLSISGSLIQRPTIVRTVTTRVRVRADCLRTNAQCNVAPTGV
ncbi:PilW family protein [Lysobacter tyrosinilyticus]